MCAVDACKVYLMHFFFISTERFISEKKPYTFNIDPDVTSIAAR